MSGDETALVVLYFIGMWVTLMVGWALTDLKSPKHGARAWITIPIWPVWIIVFLVWLGWRGVKGIIRLFEIAEWNKTNVG